MATMAATLRRALPGATPKRDDGRDGYLIYGALALIILLFVALAWVIAAKTPAWQASDEPGHVQNIETLVRGHWYSIESRCYVAKVDYVDALLSCSGDEAHQAPLYYLVMAGWQDLIGLPAHDPPRSIADLNTGGHRGDHGFLLWLRLPNVLFGAATVLMAFLTTRLIVKDPWTPVIAAALVATFPHFVFASAFVTNDNLVNLLGAALAFCALKCTTQRFAHTWMIATGATFGLLVTTKLSAIPLGFIIPVVALMIPTWRRRLALLAYGVIPAVAISSWYLIQNWVRYGDPLALRASAAYLTRINGLGTSIGVPYVVRDPIRLIFVDVPYRVLRSIWYQSGWGLFVWSLTTCVLITCVVGAVLSGLFGQHYSRKVLTVLGVQSVLACICVWIAAFETGSYSSRYALVGVTTMAALVALALRRWPLVVRWLLPAAGLVGCLVAVQQDILAVHWT